MTNPCLLSLFTISSYHAHVLTREGCPLKYCLYVTRRNRYRMFVIVTYFKIARGLDGLLIIQAARRRQCVARDHVNRYHRAFFFGLRSEFSFGLTC